MKIIIVIIIIYDSDCQFRCYTGHGCGDVSLKPCSLDCF